MLNDNLDNNDDALAQQATIPTTSEVIKSSDTLDQVNTMEHKETKNNQDAQDSSSEYETETETESESENESRVAP